jgi:hypothetical protein
MKFSFRFHKIRRFLLPVLAVALIIAMLMVKSGIVSGAAMKYALVIPAVLELMFIIVCIINISQIIKRYRTLRQAGREALDAWQKALEIVVSPRIARLATIEPRLYYALYRSYKLKSSVNHNHFTTRINSYGFLIKVIILLCFMEILAVTLLLPGKWMIWKILHLVLGLWAILWLWADYRAMVLYHNLISLEGAQFRLGLRYNQEIPWDDILLVRRISQAPPGGAMVPQMPRNYPGVLYLGAGEVCNIEIALKKPYRFQGMINDFKEVTHLLLSLENPDGFIDSLCSIQPGLYSLS